MDKIIELDEKLLLLINSWYCPVMDDVMWIVSCKWTWIPLYIILLGWLFIQYRGEYKKFIVVLFMIVTTVVLTDIMVSQIIKPWIGRLRPTHNDKLIPLLHQVKGYVGGMYGFISNHAADTMSLTTAFYLICRNKIVTSILCFWVLLNSYSRVYIGVHYPLDILGGLLFGSCVATVVYRITIKFFNIVPRCQDGV